MISRGPTARKAENTYTVSGTVFTFDPSVQLSDLKILGKGSYGVVISAFSEKHQKKVAIKKITPVTKHVYDAKHVLREIRILRYLGVHKNIVSLEDLYLREQQDELYIIMELMDSDLHQVIQSKQVLTDAHVRHFMLQICNGLKFLHDHHIIHRDLKPGNILVNRDCTVRITDFGLAREKPEGSNGHAGGDEEDERMDPAMTVHVVTRWYRSPELMLLPDGLYSYSVDMWSVGCIHAELILRRPLFPGRTFLHQLQLIFDVLGGGGWADWSKGGGLSTEARQFLMQQGSKKGKRWEEVFPSGTSSMAMHFISRCLAFPPATRTSVSDALMHPYLQGSSGGVGAGAACVVVEGLDFDFERASSRYHLKQLIVEEVAAFRKEKRGTASAKEKAPSKPAASKASIAEHKQEASHKETAEATTTTAPAPAATAATAALPRYLLPTTSHRLRSEAEGAAVKDRGAMLRHKTEPKKDEPEARGRHSDVRAERKDDPSRSPSPSPNPNPAPPPSNLQALLRTLTQPDKYDMLFSQPPHPMPQQTLTQPRKPSPPPSPSPNPSPTFSPSPAPSPVRSTMQPYPQPPLQSQLPRSEVAVSRDDFIHTILNNNITPPASPTRTLMQTYTSPRRSPGINKHMQPAKANLQSSTPPPPPPDFHIKKVDYASMLPPPSPFDGDDGDKVKAKDGRKDKGDHEIRDKEMNEKERRDKEKGEGAVKKKAEKK
eukprot:gene26608-32158_t